MPRTYIFASKATPAADLLVRELNKYPIDGELIVVNNQIELKDTLANLDKSPQYIFFFHWSWIVPAAIYENYQCVVIHTANLPYGRGGSPLQNQIRGGIMNTRVNALKMVKELDAGPIYYSTPVTLQGTINDVWLMIAQTTLEIILKMMDGTDHQAKPQIVPEGGVKVYKRRSDNQLPLLTENILEVYDFIRMLDGDGYGYEKAYLEIGKYRLEFSRASLDLNEKNILADVKITPL